VWFDQDALVGGDAWDQKIRGQIAACALFMPVVSANTQAREEGYFRLEWKLAEDRSHLMAKGKAFIVPVTVDAMNERGALVPDAFRAVQWTKLPGGETPAAFVSRVQKLLSPLSVLETARPRPVERDEGVASPSHPSEVGRRVPAAAWSVAVILAAVVIGLLVWRRSPEAAPIPAPNAGAGTRPPTTEKSAVPAAPRLGPKSIAVLPFENLSADGDANAFFAAGMHEDLITNLQLIRELRCVPRATAMSYRDTKKTAREIADELGVAFLLTGTVRRADTKLRITGTLINPRTDETLWNKPYDEVITNAGMIFEIQSKLAQAIAGELHAKLSPQEIGGLNRRPTESTAAYDLYLQTRAMRASPDGRDFPKIESLLQAAVTLDPKFGVAWSQLAWAHSYRYNLYIDRTPERFAKAKAAIEIAERLSPTEPEVILNRGYFYYFCLLDYARADEAFAEVRRLQPHAPEAYYARALIQRRQGKMKESYEGLRVAAELDPENRDYVSQYLYAEKTFRRWEQAKAVQRRLSAVGVYSPAIRARDSAILIFRATGSTRDIEAMVDQSPNAQTTDAIGRGARLDLALMRGDWPEVVRLNLPLSAVAAEVTPEVLGRIFVVATALAARGKLSEARSLVKDAPAILRARIDREPENPNVWCDLGMVEALLGHNEEALRSVRKAVDLVPDSVDAWYAPVYRVDLAFVLAWTGDKESALAEYGRLLRTAMTLAGFSRNAQTLNVHVMRHHPFYFPLQGDPRFEALLNDPKNNAPLF